MKSENAMDSWNCIFSQATLSMASELIESEPLKDSTRMNTRLGLKSLLILSLRLWAYRKTLEFILNPEKRD